MATDLIRYDLLAQDAMLRGVVRKVLVDVAESGYLPGDHHFTISFRTDAPGVRISRRLAERWPQELTIILQHQFSDLTVDEEGFGVTLFFQSIPENIYIPFSSITGFYDPSVEFALRFATAADFEEFEEEEEEEAPPARPALRAVDEKTEAAPAPAKPAPAKAEKPETPAPAKKAEAAAADGAESDSEGAAKVVSIDAFRKKT